MSEQRVAQKVSRLGSSITRMLLFVLLLCVAALAAVAYYYGVPFAKQLRDERDAIRVSVEELENTNADLLKNIPGQIDAVINQRLAELVQEQDLKLSQLTREIDRMTESEQRLKEALIRAEAQLERQSGVDQTAWRTAEAEFNVRSASQRLQVARDISAALVLLRGADQLLAGVDNRKSEMLRRLVASNIAELSALPRVDRIGLLSQLQALEQQAGQLELALLGFVPQPLSESASDDAPNPSSFFQQAMSVLSSYFVVTQLESPEVRPLSSERAALAQSSLAAIFEQARLALLMGDQSNFVASVDRATLFIRQHSSTGDSRATSIIETLTALTLVDVAPDLPDLSETLRAFRDDPRPTADTVGESSRREAQ